MENTKILSEAKELVKDLSQLPKEERRAIRYIIDGVKLKIEIDSRKKGA